MFFSIRFHNKLYNMLHILFGYINPRQSVPVIFSHQNKKLFLLSILGYGFILVCEELYSSLSTFIDYFHLGQLTFHSLVVWMNFSSGYGWSKFGNFGLPFTVFQFGNCVLSSLRVISCFMILERLSLNNTMITSSSVKHHNHWQTKILYHSMVHHKHWYRQTNFQVNIDNKVDHSEYAFHLFIQ